MSDPIAALWDAIERRSTENVEELARARRIRESREHADMYRFGDPSRFVPGQIDNRAKREKRKR